MLFILVVRLVSDTFEKLISSNCEIVNCLYRSFKLKSLHIYSCASSSPESPSTGNVIMSLRLSIEELVELS